MSFHLDSTSGRSAFCRHVRRVLDELMKLKEEVRVKNIIHRTRSLARSSELQPLTVPPALLEDVEEHEMLVTCSDLRRANDTVTQTRCIPGQAALPDRCLGTVQDHPLDGDPEHH